MARGLSLFAIVASAGLILAWAVDRILGLNLLGVRIALLTGVVACVFVVARWVVAPCFARIPITRLAALVERQYPVLGERLWTLAQMREEATLSEDMRRHLEDETQFLARDLNFAAAYPWQRSRDWGRAAAGVVVMATLWFAFIPSSRAFGQRLLHAFAANPLGFELLAEPGSAVVAKGRPTVVAARLRATHSFAALPGDVFLVDATGQRTRMNAVDAQLFTLPVTADASLRYRLVAGDAETPEYTLTFVPTAHLKVSPVVVVTPPPYASRDGKPNVPSASAVISALQFSEIRWNLSFDQPLAKGTLRWRKGDVVFDTPLDLNASGEQASVVCLAREMGNFAGEVRVMGENGIESILSLPMVAVWKDTPPQFTESLQRGNTSTTLDPEEMLRLRVAVEDAVGLERLEWEYVVNDAPARRDTLLNLAGKTAFQDDLVIPLRGKVKEGDRLQVRLIAQDNRRLARGAIAVNIPDADLTPQSTFEPAPVDDQPRWLSFQVGKAGDSPHKLAILEEHKNIARRLNGIKQELEREQQLIKHVHKTSHQMPRLSPEQNGQVMSAQKINLGQQDNLRKLGQETFVTPALRPLSRAAFDIADKELGPVNDSLEKIATGNLSSAQREDEFYKDDRQLHQAIQRVVELLKTNDELAKNRLQQEELDRIARKEDVLAERAKTLANLDPKLIEKELAELRAQQEKLLEQLREWAEKNPALKDSLAQARQTEMLKLSEKAGELAKKQKAMSAADQAKLLEKMKKEFADLAEKQQTLAGKASDLRKAAPDELFGKKTDVPAASAQQAADLLRAGLIENAIGSQGKTAEDLAELSPRLRNAVVLGDDFGQAARKLAELQDRVQQEFTQIVKDAPNLTTHEAFERFQSAAIAQKTILDAAGKLPIPAIHQKATATQREIQKHAATAAAKVQDKEAPVALDAMTQTRAKLDELARLAPEMKTDTTSTAAEKKIRAQGEQSHVLAGEQRALQEETYKKLAELMKHHGNGSGGPGDERAAIEKDVGDLAKDLMKLSQSGDSPEVKGMAAEAAMAAEQSKDLMEKSKAESIKGNVAKAGKMDNEAALKLELAGKKAEQAAQAMKSGDPQKVDPLTQSFQDSEAKMQQAAKQLGKSSAPEDLKLAADALKKTSQMSGDLFSQRKPTPSGAPAPAFDPQRDLSLTPEDFKNMKGKPWGELPGELRARIVEEMRAQFGEEYGPIIQRYFQRLADEPRR